MSVAAERRCKVRVGGRGCSVDSRVGPPLGPGAARLQWLAVPGNWFSVAVFGLPPTHTNFLRPGGTGQKLFPRLLTIARSSHGNEKEKGEWPRSWGGGFRSFWIAPGLSRGLGVVLFGHFSHGLVVQWPDSSSLLEPTRGRSVGLEAGLCS